MYGYLETYTDAELEELAADCKRALQAATSHKSYSTSGGASTERSDPETIKQTLSDIAREQTRRAGRSVPRVVGTRIGRVF